MTRPHHRKPGRRGPGLVLAALLALALAPAADAREPQIMQPPVIAGDAQIGATLQAQGARWTGGGVPSWQWFRCDSGDGFPSCRSIEGATAITYTVTDADQGEYLRVLLVVRNRDGSAWALSPATGAVPPPAPEPLPPPPPEPAPAPAPPVVEVRTEQAASPPRMMRPAPVVRIRGRTTSAGARITLLTVRAPKGARISLRCYGRGCPARRWARTASTARLLRFERELRAGTRLVIRVTKAGRIGKYTAIVIRRNRVPKRSDLCLRPGQRKPIKCPAT